MTRPNMVTDQGAKQLGMATVAVITHPDMVAGMLKNSAKKLDITTVAS